MEKFGNEHRNSLFSALLSLFLLVPQNINAEVLYKYECTPKAFVRISSMGIKKFIPPTTFWIEREYLYLTISGSLKRYFIESRLKHAVKGKQWFSASTINSRLDFLNGEFSWVLFDQSGVQVLSASCSQLER